MPLVIKVPLLATVARTVVCPATPDVAEIVVGALPVALALPTLSVTTFPPVAVTSIDTTSPTASSTEMPWVKLRTPVSCDVWFRVEHVLMAAAAGWIPSRTVLAAAQQATRRMFLFLLPVRSACGRLRCSRID